MAESVVWKTLERLSTIAVIIVAGVLLWTVVHGRTVRPRIPVPREPLSLERAPVTGSANAPVAMIIYSDFQCPYCARFVQEVWPRIQTQYVNTGRVLVAFRHLPLPIHPAAKLAAAAADCAGRQGSFWGMHDRLFENQKNLEFPTFLVYARELGLDVDRWRACYAGDGVSRVKQDIDNARALGIDATPVYLIGRRRPDGRVKVASVLNGARPFDTFASALDAVQPR